jgi:hypothetical protein
MYKRYEKYKQYNTLYFIRASSAVLVFNNPKELLTLVNETWPSYYPYFIERELWSIFGVVMLIQKRAYIATALRDGSALRKDVSALRKDGSA